MEEVTVHSIGSLEGMAKIPSNVAQITETPNGQASGFTELLKNAVESVNRLQLEAGHLQDAVASGENMNIHQAIIAGEKAGLSFQLMMQVRNKLLDAYQEISRLQI